MSCRGDLRVVIVDSFERLGVIPPPSEILSSARHHTQILSSNTFNRKILCKKIVLCAGDAANTASDLRSRRSEPDRRSGARSCVDPDPVTAERHVFGGPHTRHMALDAIALLYRSTNTGALDTAGVAIRTLGVVELGVVVPGGFMRAMAGKARKPSSAFAEARAPFQIRRLVPHVPRERHVNLSAIACQEAMAAAAETV